MEEVNQMQKESNSCSCFLWAQGAVDSDCPVHGSDRSHLPKGFQEKRTRQHRQAKGICPECGERPGKEPFTESLLHYTHGFVEFWCTICVLEKRIEKAKKEADQLPRLQKALEDEKLLFEEKEHDIETDTGRFPSSLI